ncbi:ABC transporter ATP-binding protein [Microvirga pudoricolor]|uniref:ABC transporter ATP-binding protein n=1 Tax=Microvirga pudoricolor TaxID=2778729 RepID=UPI00195108F8|nr:ABC transporter ATP-binding protein [Microvirga pudoricolor]MBM6595305.1 ABC transporter ATP-binding protein [Microvirga pudoricolor]
MLLESTNISGTPLLDVHDLAVNFGGIRALKNVHLEVKGGEFVALIGANGAGKTTTLKAILNAVTKASGEIRYRGQPTTGIPTHHLVRMGIGVVPEGRRVFAASSVVENLELGALERTPKGEASAIMASVFDLFPVLKERRGQMAGSLSGGEQQMLAMGRALMGRPELLLLDEPSMGLAPKFVDRIFEILSDLRKTKTTILLIEQNALMSLEIADKAFVIEQGRTVLSGRASDLIDDPKVAGAYLGRPEE